MSYPIYRQDFEAGSTLATACPELVDIASAYTIDSTGSNAFTGTHSLKHVGANSFIASNSADTQGGEVTFSAYVKFSRADANMYVVARATPVGTTPTADVATSFTPNGINSGISGVSLLTGVWLCVETRVHGTTLSSRVIRQDNGQYFVNTGTGSWSSTPQVVTSTIAVSGAGSWAITCADSTALWIDDLVIDPSVPAIDNPTFTITGLSGTQQLTAGGFTDPLFGVTWTSSNTSVATVNSAGLVTAVAAGTSTITATGKRDTGQTATATATVNLPAATSYTLTAPSPASGYVNNVSGNFTATPNGAYTGTLTFTLSGGGLSGTKTLTWSNSASPQTFNITPLAPGPVTVTPTSSPALTGPAAVTYTSLAQGLSVSPAVFIESVAVTATLTGTGTLWLTSAPTITVTGAGAAGTVLGSVTVTSNTSASLLVTPGTTPGSLIFHDSTTTATATALVTVPPTLWSYMSSVAGFTSGLVGSVGYTVLRSDGSTYAARTTTGVFAVGSAGYAALVSLPTSGSFAILWDDSASHFAFEVVNQFGVEPPSAAVPGGLNQSQALSEILAAVACLVSGFNTAGSSSPVFMAPDGATQRITGTVDQMGNRTGLTLSPPL